MPIQTRSGPVSFGQFLELIREDQKADLIDGVIYMASPEKFDHNDLALWLGILLRQFVDASGLGRVVINKIAFRLSDKTAPEPDLAFIRTSRLELIRYGYVDGAPDLAIEIVSPDSVDRDYEDKRRRYEESGVDEYWIIDPDERRATFLLRSPSGFVEWRSHEPVFESKVIPGFRIDTRWLWERPLRDTLPIIRALLAAKA